MCIMMEIVRSPKRCHCWHQLGKALQWLFCLSHTCKKKVVLVTWGVKKNSTKSQLLLFCWWKLNFQKKQWQLTMTIFWLFFYCYLIFLVFSSSIRLLLFFFAKITENDCFIFFQNAPKWLFSFLVKDLKSFCWKNVLDQTYPKKKKNSNFVGGLNLKLSKNYSKMSSVAPDFTKQSKNFFGCLYNFLKTCLKDGSVYFWITLIV